MTTPTPSNLLPAPNMPPVAPDLWQRQGRTIIKWMGLLFLFYLLGPVILLATDTREDAARQAWQAQERWAHVAGSALLALLCYVPIVLFSGPLATLWTTSFVTLASWLHLPFFAWLADTTLWPPVPSGTLLRWLLAYPLSGLLALLIETVQPRTVWETKRVLTPEEQQAVKALAQAQQKNKRKAAQQVSTAAKHTTPARKPRKLRPAARRDEELPAPLPPADSLWGQIDWNTIPETHPLKAAARSELARRAAQMQERTPPHHSSSPRIIDAASTHPTPPGAPPLEKDVPDYNWDEGEGSVQA